MTVTLSLEYKNTASGKKVGYVREYPGIIVQASTLEELMEEAKKGVKQYRKLYSKEDQPLVFEQVPLSI